MAARRRQVHVGKVRQCRLTPRSTPDAPRLVALPAQPPWFIIGRAGKAPSPVARVSSNVRPHWMQSRRLLLALPVGLIAALVVASFAYEYKAQRRSAELWEKVNRSAPKGATREQVESALRSEGLPFGYSAASNVIVSPWIPVGRYRLLWETQFYFQVAFDEQGRVTGFTTQRFNEGL